MVIPSVGQLVDPKGVVDLYAWCKTQIVPFAAAELVSKPPAVFLGRFFERPILEGRAGAIPHHP